MKNIIICLFLFGFIGQAHANSPTLTSLNLAVVDQHIIPSYKNLKNSTEQFNKNVQLFCRQQQSDQFITLQQQFKAILANWQSIQHIRFGPIENSLRNHRFQMWPDKRGKVSKHLRKLLASEKTEALNEDAFVHGSTAVQGFSALEMLLFNRKVNKKTSAKDFFFQQQTNFRCEVLIAISQNLIRMSKGLVYDWQNAKEPFRDYIATANQGNAFYESEREVSSLLLNNLVTQLILIVDHKLARPLGKKIEKAYGKRTESWRSHQSMANIINNLNAIQTLYQIGFSPLLKDNDLKQSIERGFADIFQSSKRINLPLFEAVKDPIQRERVLYLKFQTAKLKQLFSVELPKTLDLPLGFNSLDGD